MARTSIKKSTIYLPIQTPYTYNCLTNPFTILEPSSIDEFRVAQKYRSTDFEVLKF